MVKKKTVSKKQDRLKYLVLIAMLFLIVALFFIFTTDTSEKELNEQVKLTNALNNTGYILDRLYDKLAISIKGKPVRSNECYDPGRKYETPPIYCRQQININAFNLSDEDILKDLSVIKNSLAVEFNTKKEEYFLAKFTENGGLSGDIRFAGNELIGCYFYAYARGENWHDKDKNNSYEARIVCSGGDFDKAIYPMTE